MPVPQETNFVKQASCLFIKDLLTMAIFAELKLKKNMSFDTWVVEVKRYNVYNEVENDG